jgi:succinate dehydrogenase/fumarate reductase flavoprotein subunit
MGHGPGDGAADPYVSRRRFLGVAGAGAAAGAFGGITSVQGQEANAQAQEMSADVIVVGGGMGGLTAAARALEQGAQVILLEKAYEPGGTMKHSEGVVWTYERYEDIRNDAPDGDPELQRTVFDGILTAYDFYDSIGAPLGAAGPGRSRMRRIAPVVFTTFLARTIERSGGRILVDTGMIGLLTNARHEVIGVLAEGPSGTMRVRAKAVVLATGGWAGNGQMVTQNITRHFGALRQRNAGFGGDKPPFTGDGYWAASAIGAAPSVSGWDAFYGHMLPAVPGNIEDPQADYSMYHGAWSVAVNLHGRRFADESHGRVVGRQLVSNGENLINQEVARQPEATAAYVWDEPVNVERACADCGLGSIDKYDAYRRSGAPTAMADTLEELATQMEAWGRGIPAERVVSEIEAYNEAARNGKAWALPVPKASSTHAIPLAQPPFYAALGTSGITATYGGLKVNTQGQVLSRAGRPLVGLYAAGVDIGGFNTYAYMGNLCLGATFGHIAGTHAAKQPEPLGGWDIVSVG